MYFFVADDAPPKSAFQRVFHAGLPPHCADISGVPLAAAFIPPRYIEKYPVPEALMLK